ncbi:MAG: AIR synthase-related protein [Planctomycetota bacterium]
MTTTSADDWTARSAVSRLAVAVRQDLRDPEAERVLRIARDHGLSPSAVRTAKVYLFEGRLSASDIERITAEVLVDPVAETPAEDDTAATSIEVHPLPGVMDPAARSVADAVEALVGVRCQVQTGRRYEFGGLGPEAAAQFAAQHLANTVIHGIHAGVFLPEHLPAGEPSRFELTHVPIRGLNKDGLLELSARGHLFLDLTEMQAIQNEYQQLGREPTDIELETLAQTWSEHCVHKTLKSTVRYTAEGEDSIDWSGRPGVTDNPDGSVTIDNLLKSTVAAATFELIDEGLDWTLSVFVDNAGIIRFDDETAVCVKAETHNRPSAIEPYGGAATGIGGCIRDIIGTGLAAKPVAATDVFCVGTPTIEHVPDGCIHPGRILERVVAGVRDYGNRMGIPTLNGAVWFDDRHVGNPLVFCGCIGVLPADMIHGDARPGDLIVALGGRTGRDGIHGATFSSGEVTATHADEFSHAVQIGNAIEEKRVLDAILRARDHASGCLFTAITDCGAGGFSSAVGEMGEKVGATVHLDKAPLKYDGLTYTEIWISEAQERMVLAVDPAKLDQLQAICDEEHVELAVLGEFGAHTENGEPELVLNHSGTAVGRLPMPFLHDGIPTPTREAIWSPARSLAPREWAGVRAPDSPSSSPASLRESLLQLLAHPNIASKRSIIRQYDHEVQGNTILKPLVGPGGEGPGDAAVIEPVPGSGRGLAIACGLATNVGDPALGGDPYDMALQAIDECVRNLVCVGANPDRIAILDNFCWPSCAKPQNLAALVRACVGCYDAAKAYKTPFISGKDSLNNQFTTKDGETIEIPPTLLITGVGIVDDLSKCVTMDAKHEGSSALIVGPKHDHQWRRLGASHYAKLFGIPREAYAIPKPSPEAGRKVAACIAEGIRRGMILAAHDLSEGGAAVAIAEMLIASDGIMGFGTSSAPTEQWFSEAPHRYLIQPADEIKILDLIEECDLDFCRIGFFDDSAAMTINDETIPVADLAEAWLNGISI